MADGKFVRGGKSGPARFAKLRMRQAALAALASIAGLAGHTRHANAASSNFTSTSGGIWSSPANWNASTGVPGSIISLTNTDTATFNIASGSTVTIDQPNQDIGSLTFTGSITSSGNSIGNSSSGNILYLTSGGTILDNAAATGTQTINAPLAFEGAYTINDASVQATPNQLVFNGAFYGSSSLTLLGTGATTASIAITLNNNLLNFTGPLNIDTGGYDKVNFAVSTDAAPLSGSVNIGSATYTAATFYTTQIFGPNVAFNIYGVGSGENLGALRLDGGGVVLGAVTLNSASTTIGSNTGTSVIGGNISGSGDAFTKLGAGTILLYGTNTYTGGTNVSGGTLQLTTAALPTSGNLTIGSGATALINTGNGYAESFNNVISGAGTLAVNGTGTLTLSGAETYTGPTSLIAGTLALTNSASLTYNSTTSTLSLGGGTLQLASSTAATTFVSTTIASGGASAIASTSANLLTLGAITRTAAGGTVDFGTLPSGGIATTSTNNATGILGAWATTGGGTAYAMVSSGLIAPYTGGTLASSAALGSNATGYAGLNVDVDSSQTPNAAITPNTLRFINGAQTLTLQGTNTIGGNGILFSSSVGSAASNINGGTLTAGTAGGDLIIDQSSTGTATISTIIANNTSASTLTKSGAGTLTLSANNTYTGTTYVDQGTLIVNNRTSTNPEIYNVAAGATLYIGTGQGQQYSDGVTVNGTGASSATGLYLNGGQYYNYESTLALATAPTTIHSYGTGTAYLEGFDTNYTMLSVAAAASGSVIASTVGIYPASYGYTMNITPGANNATGDLTIAGPFVHAATYPSSYNGVYFDTYKNGLGSLLLTGASTATYGLYIPTGELLLGGGNNRLPVTAGIVLGNGSSGSGQLLLNGISQQLFNITAYGTGNNDSVVGNSATASTLVIGFNGSNASSTSVAATVGAVFAGNIGGPGVNQNNLGFTMNGSGGVFGLSGTNTYTGATTITNGTLSFLAPSALPGYINDYITNPAAAATVTVASGAGLTIGLNGTGTGFSTADIPLILANAKFASGSSFGLDTTSGSLGYNGNLTAALGFTKDGVNTLFLSGTNTYTGKTLVAGGTLEEESTASLPGYATSGNIKVVNGTLTLGVGGTGQFASADIANVLANTTFTATTTAAPTAIGIDTSNAANATATGFTYAGAISGSIGLTKTGYNPLTLSGANTYTGTTNLSGGTLFLTGSIASTSPLVINNATLSTSASAAQTFAGTGLGAGGSAVVNNGGALALGTITRSTSGTLDFSGTGTTSVINASTNGILGGYATFGGGATWAVSAGTGTVSGAVTGLSTYYTTTTGGTVAANYSSSSNVDVTTSVSPAALITVNSLRFNTSSATTLGLTGANVVSSGGILVTPSVGANLSTIFNVSTGTLTTTSADLVIQQYNNVSGGGLTISAPITGSVGLTKSGPGLLQLTAANTLTGNTVVNGGTLVLSYPSDNGSGVLGSPLIIVNNGATIFLNSTSADELGYTVGRNALVINSGGTVTDGSTAYPGARSTIENNITMTGGLLSGTATNAFELISGAGFVATSDAAGNPATVTAPVTLAQALTTFNVSRGALSPAYDMIVSSAITTYSGVPTLIKTGTGILDLAGANSYTGGNLLSAGEILLGNASGLGTAGPLTMEDSSTLDLAGYASTVGPVSLVSGNIISSTAGGTLNGSSYTVQSGTASAGLIGTGSLTKISSGTVTLSGTNTYTSGTTVTAGTLAEINTVSLPGQTTAGKIAVNGGTLMLSVGTSPQFQATDVSNVLTNGTFALGSFLGFDTQFAPTGFTYPNSIAGNEGIIKINANTLTLTASNSFVGQVFVNGGVLNIQNSNALGAATLATVANGASLQMQSSSGITTPSTTALTLGGTGASTATGALENVAGTNVFGGLVTLTANTTFSSDAGSLNLSNSGAITGSGYGLTLTGAGNGTITGAIGTGAGTVTMNGTGTWTLNGVNSYLGLTTVNSGTLVVNGGVSGRYNFYTVAQNATLDLGYSSGGGYTGGITLNGSGLASSAGVFFKSGINFQTNSDFIIQTAPTTVSTIGNTGTATLQGFDVNTGAFLTTTAAASGTIFTPNIAFSTGSYGYTINVASGTNTATGDLTLEGVISGGGAAGVANNGYFSAGLNKIGTGSLLLTGSNTYTTATSIGNGSIILSGGNNLLPIGTTVQLGYGTTSGQLVLNGVNQQIGGLVKGGTGTADAVVGGSATASLLTINYTTTSTVDTFAGTLGGTGTYQNNFGLTTSGAGTVALSGSNTYTGNTNVSAGTLTVSGAIASTPVNVASGATLTVASGGNISTGTNLTDAGTVNFNNPTRTIASLNGSGAVNLAGTALNISNGGTFSGVIADNGSSGSLIASGGTLTLSGASTFSGGTTLNAGSLIVANTTGSATGTGNVTLNAGTLASTTTGSIAAIVIAGSGAHTIAPGGVGTIGSLTVGALQSDSLTTINFDLGTGSGPIITNGDLLTVGTGGTIIGTGTNITFGTNPTTTGLDYRLIGDTSSGAVVDGINLSNFSLPTPPTGDTYTLSTSVDPGYIDLVVATSGPANLTWNNAGGTGDGITWDITTNQNWNNGTAAAVYHEGDKVTFNDSNNYPANPNAYSVTLNTVVHPTSVIVSTAGSYSITGSGGIADVTSGHTPLTVTGTGSLTLGGSNTYTGGTTVGTGSDTPTLNLSGGSALPANSALTINTGATVNAISHGSSPITVLQVSALTNTGTLNLTNNDLVVRASAGLSLAQVTAQVAAGYNGGTWTNTVGSVITSSTAAGDTTYLTALGVATGSAVVGGSIDGVAVASGDLIVKYTYYGDTNLDGAVDGSDYTNIDNGFNTGATGWQNGDFNYDGVVDGSDYTLIDNAYNMQGTSLGTNSANLIASATAQIAGGSSAVPEPTTLGMLGIGAVGLLARRKRKHSGN